MFFYIFKEAERDRYFAACAVILGPDNTMPRLAVEIQGHIGTYVAVQTIWNWWSVPGRIPSDVAVVLVEQYKVELGDLCPWLKHYRKRRG